MSKRKFNAAKTKAKIPYTYGCVLQTQHAVCGNNWLHCERIGVISYVRLRLRFVARIWMWQTELIHVAIQNAPAHELNRTFQA